MANILFVVPPQHGHFNTTLSMGVELTLRGHAASWLSTGKIPAHLLPAHSQMLLPENTLAQHSDRMAWCNSKSDWIRDANKVDITTLIQDEMLHPVSYQLFEEYKDIMCHLRPDIVVADAITGAWNMGGMAAYANNIPYITLWSTPFDYLRQEHGSQVYRQWFNSLLIKFQRQVGISAQRRVDHSAIQHLILSSAALLNYEKLPDTHKLVGPAILHRHNDQQDFAWGKLHDMPAPKILVSLGTLLADEAKAFFNKVITAFGNKPVTVVVSAKPDLFDRWPDNFIVSSYVPQLELMPYLDAVICHAGYNTTVEALCHSCPLIVIPRAHDQFSVAGRIVESDCGIKLKYGRLTAEHLQRALGEVLHNVRYRRAANRMGTTLLAAGGTKKAVDHILMVVKNVQTRLAG